MHSKDLIVFAIGLYMALNFLCALALHVHAERQAHLRVRRGDVVVHFVLLTIFAIPALVVILAEALFGERDKKATPKLPPATPTMTHAGARAA